PLRGRRDAHLRAPHADRCGRRGAQLGAPVRRDRDPRARARRRGTHRPCRPRLPRADPRRRQGTARRAMNVAIIGTGNMARALATRALAGGHRVVLVGTALGKAEDLADELTGEGDVAASEEASGDVVVLAVPFTE